MTPKPLLSGWLWRLAGWLTAALWLATLVYALHIISQTLGGG